MHWNNHRQWKILQKIIVKLVRLEGAVLRQGLPSRWWQQGVGLQGEEKSYEKFQVKM